MLRRRLISTVVVAGAAIGLTACGGDEIEQAVVRPGITAMEEAQSETCALNRSTLQSAIDYYTTLEGEPPPDEAALVPDFIRQETTDWDIVDGELVAENPACGEVPDVTELDDIVTTSAPAVTADELLAAWTEDDIAGLGGIECATELTEIMAATYAYADERADDPGDLSTLVDAGYLDDEPTLWTTDGLDIVPADGSGCTDLRN